MRLRFEGAVDGDFAERLVNFALALIVATLIAAASAYVLSSALLGPNSNAPAHRTAAATLARHAHS